MQPETFHTFQSAQAARDYALAFLADVNWHEISEHYQEEEQDA